MTMADPFTPAFIEMAKDASLGALDTMFRSTERHRILGGKSARLLRRGDRVALRDLNPDLDEGTAVVEQVRPSVGSTVHVLIRGGQAHLVHGSRLVLVSRDIKADQDTDPAMTTSPSEPEQPALPDAKTLRAALQVVDPVRPERTTATQLELLVLATGRVADYLDHLEAALDAELCVEDADPARRHLFTEYGQGQRAAEDRARRILGVRETRSAAASPRPERARQR